MTRRAARRRRRALGAGVLCVAFLAGCGRAREPGPSPAPAAARSAPAVHDTAAPPAEAAYLLVERPSGRVIAGARETELDRPVLPGSVAKIALLVAALESGVVDARTALVCRRDLVVDGHRLTCSHPDLGRPLTASEALAHSCNSFFVTVASRVPRETLNAARLWLGLAPVGPHDPLVPAALGLAGPRVAPRELAVALERAVVESGGRLSGDAREILLDGLRGSAAYGTASALAALDGVTYAKTGTAPMPGGGYLGLVVAWRPVRSPSAPPGSGRSLVVMAPGGSGRDAAEIARRVLEAAAAVEPSPAARTVGPGGAAPGDLPARLRIGEVRGRGYRVTTMDLEEYVARAVAGEGAPGAPPAALEALAVTARTFAVANRGRHASEGFDLCDLTHCQALRLPTAASRAAAAATAGRILVFEGRPAEVYYSASCGGRSATPGDIWEGAPPGPPYLVSRAEPECREESRWMSEIPARDLERALGAAGLRGHALRDLRIAGRTVSGRVARVRVDGFEPAEISGEAFRLAVGRTLGWNLVRSHLFDVRRTAAGYRFTGTGFGHGVGLCVMGASRLGFAGRSADDILATYFPGANVTPPAAPVIRLELPAGEEGERQTLLALLAQALRDLQAKTGVPAPARVTVRVHPTVESFRRATGRPWWVAGAASGDVIDLLPVTVLNGRHILRRTVAHELAHVILDPALADRPLWVREGLAQVFAGEVTGPPRAPGACPDDAEMRGAASADQMREVYGRAAACAARALGEGWSWRDIGK